VLTIHKIPLAEILSRLRLRDSPGSTARASIGHFIDLHQCI
jgi:hypothetical protein